MNFNQYISLSVFPVFVMLLISCQDNGYLNSGVLNEEEQTGVITVDTLTIESSTVLMDSVDTQGAEVILTGSYVDNFLGRVSSNGYLKVRLGKPFTVENGAVYDSLSLRLNMSYVYGSDSEPFRIDVHKVSEKIEPDEDESRIYNFNSFKYNSETLGQKIFKPDDFEDEEIEITISDTFGKDLFEAALNRDEILTDQDEFEDFFKGIVLVGSHISNDAVIGFKADSIGAISFRLYYSENVNEVSKQLYHEFPVVNESSFSNVFSEFPKLLNNLSEPRDEVTSSKTTNELYIQSGVGLMTRIDFPHIDALYDISSNPLVSSAILYIRPLANTYTSDTPLPDPITLYVADNRNQILSEYKNSDGYAERASPNIDDEFNKSTYYSLDVTSFIQAELNRDRFMDWGLLLSTASEDYRTTVDRVVFGDDDHKDYEMILRVILIDTGF